MMSDDSNCSEFLRCRRGKLEIDYTCGKPIAMRFKTVSKSRRVKTVTCYFIRDIVQWRQVLRGGSVIRHEFKVAWEGWDPEHDVWMREEFASRWLPQKNASRLRQTQSASS